MVFPFEAFAPVAALIGLTTVERIVIDGIYRLDREIDALRGPAN